MLLDPVLWSAVRPVLRPGPELVKVAGVAPTELQELGGGSQSQPTTQPSSCWISMQTAPVSFGRCFLQLIHMFFHIYPYFTNAIYFLPCNPYFVAPKNSFRALAWPRYYRRVGNFYQP